MRSATNASKIATAVKAPKSETTRNPERVSTEKPSQGDSKVPATYGYVGGVNADGTVAFVKREDSPTGYVWSPPVSVPVTGLMLKWRARDGDLSAVAREAEVACRDSWSVRVLRASITVDERDAVPLIGRHRHRGIAALVDR